MENSPQPTRNFRLRKRKLFKKIFLTEINFRTKEESMRNKKCELKIHVLLNKKIFVPIQKRKKMSGQKLGDSILGTRCLNRG